MLNGSLDVFPLPDVLRFVAASGVTGRIEIARDEIGGELSLDRGRYVAARLAEDEAPSTVDEALDVCVLLFDASGGTFQVVEEEWVGGPLDLDAEDLTLAVERRREEWAAVVAVLGSLDDPLALVPHLPEGTKHVTITADQWRYLALVDGSRSVQDIARDAATSVYATGAALAEMANMGLIARGEGAPWRDEPVDEPAPKKRGKAAAAAEADEEDPAELLRELVEEAPDDEPADGDEPATVRPLRPPTREEQRLRLRR